ncbi:hypothetical protein GCM10029963_53100 [Micromonospora andamanensis]
MTDNEGNTWEQVVYAPTSGSVGRRIEYWICQPTDAFATISPAFTGAGTAYASLYEITGHDAGDAVDQAAADHRSASTSPAPVEITPSGTGRLAVAAVAWSPNGPSLDVCFAFGSVTTDSRSGHGSHNVRPGVKWAHSVPVDPDRVRQISSRDRVWFTFAPTSTDMTSVEPRPRHRTPAA